MDSQPNASSIRSILSLDGTAGRTFADDLAEASPFPGAKAYLKVNGDKWDEREWLTELIRRTEADLPAPKARKPKVARKP